jgi:signal peptidase I
MRPALVAGDIVWCVTSPRISRGDIVVFELKDTGEKSIKRVVGLPGDSVTYVGKQLFVNGRLASKTVRERLAGTDSADLLLEQRLFDRNFNVLELYGQSLTEMRSAGSGYFLLGDNRDDSIDSRHYGRLRESRIKCKALAVLATEIRGTINFNGARWL